MRRRATGEFYLQSEQPEPPSTTERVSVRVLRGPDARRPVSGEWAYELRAEVVRASRDWWQLRGLQPRAARTWLQWEKSLHPEDVERVRASLDAVRQGQREHFSVEYRELDPEGGWLWISSFGWTEDGDDGRRIVGADTDISHLKRSEQTVVALSRKLELALRASGVGLWEIHMDTGRFECDDALRAMYGFGPECGETICFGMWRSRVHPEDRERAVRAAHAAMSACGVLEQEFRILLPSGEVRHIVASCRYYTNPDGKPRFLGVDRDVTATHERESQLQRLAYYDPLTGLPNRVLFQQELERLLEEPLTTASGALLLLDLDRFQEVNDSLGHAVGDELLRRVARVLEERCRERHFVARVGGDEFAIVVEGCSDLTRVSRLAKDLVGLLDRIIRLKQGDVVVSTSIGVGCYPQDGTTRTELLRSADLALYRAKEKGRTRTEFFQAHLSLAAKKRLHISRDLRRALQEDNGLTVYYQPQVDLGSGRVSGLEALLRWTHPTKGPISPVDFIPVAEQSHLICDLGLWVLRRAARQAKAWLDAGEPERVVSVNVSAAQISLSDFVGDVARVLEEVQLKPELLCLELTESLFVEEVGGQVRGVLEQLSEMGIQLALDDFGTGYSSLGYLRELPFKTLKIDRAFIREATASARGQELLTGIVALGRGLEMRVIAEGAEDEADLALLRKIGCEKVQGFVFSRPTPPEQAVAYARSREEGALTASEGALAS